MRQPWISAFLVAAALGLPCRPAAAQAPDQPATRDHPGPKLKAARRKPAAVAKPGPASPALIVPPPSGSAGDSSLERRRKTFFSKPDDAGGAAGDPTPPVGVTLGGSGGITPGMGFKF